MGLSNEIITEESTIPQKVGRPSEYTQEMADRICHGLADGRSLRSVTQDEDTPSMATVFKWMRENPEFLNQYARAKEESTDAKLELMEEIGDQAIDASYKADPKAANAVVSAYKLKADSIKWTMSKLKPKKYGDKVDLTSGGEKIQGNAILFSDFKKVEEPNATDSQPIL